MRVSKRTVSSSRDMDGNGCVNVYLHSVFTEKLYVFHSVDVLSCDKDMFDDAVSRYDICLEEPVT